MRRFLAASAIIACVSILHSPAALADSQDFTLVNRTGYQIDEVYVSQSSSRNWGNDVMGADALDNGNKISISFDAPANACRWDMMVKYNDGDKATWNNLDLCSIEKVTLYWDKKTQVTRAVTE